jgi:hypothetical protein
MAPEPEEDIMNEKNPRPLDEDDIALLKTYVSAPPRPDRSISRALRRELLAVRACPGLRIRFRGGRFVLVVDLGF